MSQTELPMSSISASLNGLYEVLVIFLWLFKNFFYDITVCESPRAYSVLSKLFSPTACSAIAEFGRLSSEDYGSEECSS